MDSNREASPDWLREFQAPKQTFTTLSSSPSNSPSRDVPGSSKKESSRSFEEEEHQSKLGSQEKGVETVLLSDSEEKTPKKIQRKSKASKSNVGTKRSIGKKNVKKETLTAPKVKSESDIREDSKKGNGANLSTLKVEGEDDGNKMEIDIDDALGVDEEIPEKRTEPQVASRLPLVFADKVHRSKALLECEDEALDFSGDVGAIGRLAVSKTSSNDHEILLDLKGAIYKTTVVPSYTFCVVNFGTSEAKIEAIMDDFIQLQPHSNIYEAETMVEGTLDGFMFDSDDEGDRVIGVPGKQDEQNNEAADIPATKSKKKSDKQMGGMKRKRSTAKPTKKGVKKAPASKKQRVSKK
ncbi:hypothetical protein SUGI_0108750 [Cryptomeria japonica]|uniref:DNA-binding protein BIN4 n=1 Tax=Cryptomeria japonica TaxID=3369 RepID=UPI002408ABBB|nr:DNA-binding protein BIN4 [Cryptomeria japonica]GLJ09403.1 hypothetical protein SUGI_0108750 [Cryptomeria japonica]